MIDRNKKAEKMYEMKIQKERENRDENVLSLQRT